MGGVRLTGGDDGVIDAAEFGAWSPQQAGGALGQGAAHAAAMMVEAVLDPAGRATRAAVPRRRSPRRDWRRHQAGRPTGRFDRTAGRPPAGTGRRGSRARTLVLPASGRRVVACRGSARRRRSLGASRRHRSGARRPRKDTVCGARSSRRWPPADGSNCCRCRARHRGLRRAMGATRPQRPQILAGRGAQAKHNAPPSWRRAVTTRTRACVAIRLFLQFREHDQHFSSGVSGTPGAGAGLLAAGCGRLSCRRVRGQPGRPAASETACWSCAAAPRHASRPCAVRRGVGPRSADSRVPG